MAADERHNAELVRVITTALDARWTDSDWTLMAETVLGALADAGYVVLRADDVVGRKSAEMAVRIMAEGGRTDD